MRPERDSYAWAKTWEELGSLTDDELRRQHDQLAAGGDGMPGTAVGLGYYLEELRRRDFDRRERRMERLTWAIGLLTLANLAFVAIDVIP